jgi:hypothetical protein
MPSFTVTINGRNFLTEIGGLPKKLGFFTTRDVEAVDQQQAVAIAMQLMRGSDKLRALVRNPASDPPQMFVEEVVAIDRVDPSKPVPGFSFYDDVDEEEPAN